MSSPNYEYTFLPQVFHYEEATTDDILLQIQRSVIHTANLARVIFLFQESVVAFTEEEEEAKRGNVFHQSIRAFRRDTCAGNGMPTSSTPHLDPYKDSYSSMDTPPSKTSYKDRYSLTKTLYRLPLHPPRPRPLTMNRCSSPTPISSCRHTPVPPT